MKKILLVMLTLAAVVLVGCATDTAYIKAQADAAVSAGNARVAEAQAAAEEARAVIALAAKIDSGGASAYLAVKGMKGLIASQAPQSAVTVQRPRDFLDYLAGITQAVGVIGQVAVPIASIRANRDVAIAGYNRDLGISQSQQAGETARTQTVAGIATAIATAPRPPTTQTTITVNSQGDANVGSGTIDRRNCPTTGGQAGPGGAITGTATVPSIIVPGGPGGSATGGC